METILIHWLFRNAFEEELNKSLNPFYIMETILMKNLFIQMAPRFLSLNPFYIMETILIAEFSH